MNTGVSDHEIVNGYWSSSPTLGTSPNAPIMSLVTELQMARVALSRDKLALG